MTLISISFINFAPTNISICYLFEEVGGPPPQRILRAGDDSHGTSLPSRFAACLSVCLLDCLSDCLLVLPVCLFVALSVSLCVFLIVVLFICLSVCLPAYLSACLYVVRPSVCVSVCFSVCLCVCPPAYLPACLIACLRACLPFRLVVFFLHFACAHCGAVGYRQTAGGGADVASRARPRESPRLHITSA